MKFLETRLHEDGRVKYRRGPYCNMKTQSDRGLYEMVRVSPGQLALGELVTKLTRESAAREILERARLRQWPPDDAQELGWYMVARRLAEQVLGRAVVS